MSITLEKLTKNIYSGAASTVDGLAMGKKVFPGRLTNEEAVKSMALKVSTVLLSGIAYILRLLNQGKAFDALHWFESVREKYIREKSAVERQSAESGGDQKLQQTLALTLKRLETYQKVRVKIIMLIFVNSFCSNHFFSPVAVKSIV